MCRKIYLLKRWQASTKIQCAKASYIEIETVNGQYDMFVRGSLVKLKRDHDKHNEEITRVLHCPFYSDRRQLWAFHNSRGDEVLFSPTKDKRLHYNVLRLINEAPQSKKLRSADKAGADGGIGPVMLDTAALGDASRSPPVVDLASIRRPEPAAQMRADEN